MPLEIIIVIIFFLQIGKPTHYNMRNYLGTYLKILPTKKSIKNETTSGLAIRKKNLASMPVDKIPPHIGWREISL